MFDRRQFVKGIVAAVACFTLPFKPEAKEELTETLMGVDFAIDDGCYIAIYGVNNNLLARGRVPEDNQGFEMDVERTGTAVHLALTTEDGEVLIPLPDVTLSSQSLLLGDCISFGPLDITP